MKKYLLGVLITLSGLLALAAGAQAQTGDIVVNIKQSFVAGGKTLPPGTYRVYQGFPGVGKALLLRSVESGQLALLFPTAQDPSVPQEPHIKLKRVEDVYYLSEVATEFGVYTLAPPHIVPRTAKAGDIGSMSSSGSN